MNFKTSNISIFIALFAVLLYSIPSVYAFGYGTSAVSLSRTSISLNEGTSGTVGYKVSLATGNTWGTDLIIQNQSVLSSEGIYVEASQSAGDPPFSGNLTLNVSTSAKTGAYYISLGAIGDDPSSSNATLLVQVMGPISPAKVSGNPNSSSSSSQNSSSGKVVGIAGNIQGEATNSSTQPAQSVPPKNATATAPHNIAVPSNGYPLSTSSTESSLPAALAIFLMVVISIYMVYKMKLTSTRLVVLGVLLILVGTTIWLYGDFGAGTPYVWSGVAGILLGTAIWLYGDFLAGAFKVRK